MTSHFAGPRIMQSIALATWLAMPFAAYATDAGTLLPQTQLEDCRVHVVGIYRPQGGSQDDRVAVQVKPTGHSMAVVLCSYFGSQWNLSIDEKADVKQIILSGWFPSSLVFKDPESNIPVRQIFGSANAGTPDPNYFWAYGWHSAEGRKVRDVVKTLVGRDIDTFQGSYEGNPFVIDGKLGAIPTEKVLEVDQNAGKSAAQPKGPNTNKSNEHDRNLVEKHVRQLFDLETEDKRDRIASVEDDLARIKEKFAKRLQNRDQIIRQRVDALVTANAMSTDTNEPKAADNGVDPLVEGWNLWHKRQWEQALPRFEQSVTLYPENAEAWNGLGWTQFQLGRLDAAIESFDKAIKISSTHGGARNGRGRALMAQGKLEEAEKELLRATLDTIAEYGETRAIEFGVTAAWFGLVDVNLKQGDNETAREWATRYLKVRPDDTEMNRLFRQLKE